MTPALTLTALALLAPPALPAAYTAVRCAGHYPLHLQGICTDGKGRLYWCFTDVLVKTDAKGAVLKRIPVKNHHGDLCHHDGKLFVAVNLGKFNDPAGKADSWVYVYDADDLSPLGRHAVPEVKHGAGGIARHDGRFFVVGGLPEGVPENYVYEYDPAFTFHKKHVLKSGYTRMGIQTATFSQGSFWFGCYGGQLLKADPSLKSVARFAFDCALGIVGIQDERFLVGRGERVKGKGHTGSAILGVPDAKKGLAVRDE